MCPWCCVTHLLATAGAALLLVRSGGIMPRAAFQASGAAAVAVGVLALAQGFARTEQPAGDAVVGVYELDAATTPGSRAARSEVALLGGEVSFRLDELPLVGVSQPEHVIFALTDYTCPHCRRLNDMLQEIGISLGGQVAVLKLPATRAGTDSAKVHRHMLALWKVDPKMHWTLERALAEGRVRAGAREVEAEAIRLVGASRFAEANVRHNAWITEQMDKTRRVQDANREKTGKATLPQLVLGDELLVGAHSDPQFYYQKIEEHFGLAASTAARPAARRMALGRDGDVRLGKLAPGAAVPFKVTFENRSERPLELSWLNMGAGITAEKFTRDEISTDSEGELDLVLRVPEDARPGQLLRSVTVNNSTGQEPLTFRIHAEVGSTVAQINRGPGE